MTLKDEEIVEGGYYRTRSGDVVGPLKQIGSHNRRFIANGQYFACDGRYLSSKEDGPHDLIKRVYVSDTPPEQRAPASPAEQPEPKVGDVWKRNDGTDFEMKIIDVDLTADPEDQVAYRLGKGRLAFGRSVAFFKENATRISPPMPERKVLEGWVNVYAESEGFLYLDRDTADKRGVPGRLACVKVSIPYTVGEGLEP